MSPFTPSRWVTVDEFAKITGLTPKAVRRRLERGQLPYSRALGPRSTRIDFRAVSEQLEQDCRHKKGSMKGEGKAV
jgi:excisionase family DNA binding protein